jgi:phosphoadenosine phosphosulfate reductase
MTNKIKNKNWQELILQAVQSHQNITFSTSFGLEDQVITHFIAQNKLPVSIFTIDTGRLFEETRQVWQRTIDAYGLKIESFAPDAHQLGEFVVQNGINAFYQNVHLRQQCCHVRKVEPLKKALKSKNLWISGVRQGQSAGRARKDFFEFDDVLQIKKFYPLLQESTEDLWEYIKKNDVPFNALFERGFKSIGCAPCSRAVGKDEDERSGRWWWENADVKSECGLHR